MNCNDQNKWTTAKAIFYIAMLLIIIFVAVFNAGCTCKESDSLQSKACIYEEDKAK